MTKQNRERNLMDHWLWEPPMLKTFTAFMTAIPALICCIFLIFIGPRAFIILSFACIGPLIALGYWVCGKKINTLQNSLPQDEGTIIPGLIVIGKIEAAGILLLCEETLALHPVMGNNLEIKAGEITAVREVTWFNGSKLFGKTGFWLTVPGHKRLACAVPNSYADDFRKLINTEK